MISRSPSDRFVVAWIALIMALSVGGCRNQCGPCMPSRPFAMSPRIPAPATHSWTNAQVLPPASTWNAPMSAQATSGPLPTGTSQLISQPYNTTSIDPRADTSRLAVSDASQVAAPAALGVNPNAGPLAQALYRGQVPPGTSATNVRQGTFEYLAPGAPTGNTYFAAGPPQQVGGRQVLAQATTLPMEQNPNYQNGWRPPPQSGGQPTVNR